MNFLTRRPKYALPWLILAALLTATSVSYASPPLKRTVMPTPNYSSLPQGADHDVIVLKLAEGQDAPQFSGNQFVDGGDKYNQLNARISAVGTQRLEHRFKNDPMVMKQDRTRAMSKSGMELPDLSLYYEVHLDPNASAQDKLDFVRQLNESVQVEIAFFAPKPALATMEITTITPGWESGQYYLQPAPTGIDAYAGWAYPGGKGDNIKVIDIEGNWIQTHEDLHGGTDDFHIAGTRINDAGWWNHGTAVLGEIAADSNGFGMTGIAFNVDLGTVSVGSMSAASAINTAVANSQPGDITLIELHAPGPHYNYEDRPDQLGYVAMEYWQDTFDAILVASAGGYIIVEAGGNGAENFDDETIYGRLFDRTYRFSGAIMVAASNSSHQPASFTNYGDRLDVHAFGTWDVYTLGYGDLYGSSPDDYYTNSFAGTSSASPIIVGACAVLQGVYKAAYGSTMDHDQLRSYLTTYSTPQAPSSKPIGPLPDLAGSCEEIIGVTLSADTTFGWVPLEVGFTGNSGLTVDDWLWDFGDGFTDSVQNPVHTYNDRGMFDVELEITAEGDVRAMTRSAYIVVLNDSLVGDTTAAENGSMVEVTISAANTLPLKELIIPIEYSGTLSLELLGNGWTTEGCRTSGLDLQQLTHVYPGARQMTIRLANTGSSSNLAPGSGPILKLQFELDGVPIYGQDAEIQVDGYSTRTPKFSSDSREYQPLVANALVTYYSCCIGMRGNINNDAEQAIDITDLIYLVQYMFQNGPEPLCMKEANVNGDMMGEIDITDLIHLVQYMFQEGPEPFICY
jgi:PKD repeat protein